MMRLTLRLRAKCNRHPRYNPVEGEAGIKAGCSTCRELLALYQKAQGLVNASKLFSGEMPGPADK
jgi:hypothetical protein